MNSEIGAFPCTIALNSPCVRRRWLDAGTRGSLVCRKIARAIAVEIIRSRCGGLTAVKNPLIYKAAAAALTVRIVVEVVAVRLAAVVPPSVCSPLLRHEDVV